MTELSIRPEEIRDALDRYVQSYDPGTASREEVGRVLDAGDGIAHVEGLPSAMTNELRMNGFCTQLTGRRTCTPGRSWEASMGISPSFGE